MGPPYPLESNPQPLPAVPTTPAFSPATPLHSLPVTALGIAKPGPKGLVNSLLHTVKRLGTVSFICSPQQTLLEHLLPLREARHTGMSKHRHNSCSPGGSWSRAGDDHMAPKIEDFHCESYCRESQCALRAYCGRGVWPSQGGQPEKAP